MAKTLPPVNPVMRAAYTTVARLTKKLQSGKPLSGTEQKRYDRAMAKLKKAGYSVADINNSILGKLGDPRKEETSFGIQDLTVKNPVDTAKTLLDKAHLDFLTKLGDPHTWLRVALIVVGGILFLVGLGLLLKELGAAKALGLGATVNLANRSVAVTGKNVLKVGAAK